MPDNSYSQTVDAAGRAIISLNNRPKNWEVSQITVSATAVLSGATCGFFKNGILVAAITPNRGTASGEPTIKVYASDKATIEWSGMTPGVVCQAFVAYEVFK